MPCVRGLLVGTAENACLSKLGRTEIAAGSTAKVSADGDPRGHHEGKTAGLLRRSIWRYVW